MTYQYDAIVVGGGIAGLWLAHALHRRGHSVVLIEKDRLGGGQTLVSQGMVHGGQKYSLQGITTSQATTASQMPDRWQACFEGRGEVDLTAVKFLSSMQVMWPTGSVLSAAALAFAARSMNAKSAILPKQEIPEALEKAKPFAGPVYALPERVLDVRSLLVALASPLAGRLCRGDITAVTPDGNVVASGQSLRAQLVVFAAGAGNEAALEMLNVRQQMTQRRPLRQVMVRHMPHALFGHGVAVGTRPRITVTSHRSDEGEYVWYLGGAVAEEGALLDETAALRFAGDELRELFPAIAWDDKEWSTWYGDRAEPVDRRGELPNGPFVYRHEHIAVAWPTKLTFTPGLSDTILELFKSIAPTAGSAPPPLPPAEIGSYPWESAVWRKID